MGAFEYQALDLRGRTRKGVSTGDSARQVRQKLREQGLTPMDVVAVAEDTETSHKSDSHIPSPRTRRTRIKTSELAIVTRQFATLLGSGLTVEESLSSLIQQSESHQTKSVLSGIRSHVVEGHSLADAISQYPRSFPEIYQASVAAGEQSGNLDEVLERLAQFIETRQGIQQRISVALIYPLVLTVVAIIIVVGLLIYVVPKVVKVFEDTGQQLPFLTETLITVSQFMLDHGVWLVAAVVTACAACVVALKNAAVRMTVHQIFLKIPGLRRLSRGANTARMARTLAIMTGSGVPLLSAMHASEGVVSNLVLRKNLADAAAEVAEGVSINGALARSSNFPPLLIQMVASGEQSGRLDDMLDKAASALERELESRIAVLVGLFEPAMILVMGGVVLIIVLAILLPIFDLNQLIG
ncbi:MAG: type II secretion system inner membrane protein GspF [Arenicellales bacterium]|nr:type II secretion system inner membrane protein GspF [Arenicellales bacterium]